MQGAVARPRDHTVCLVPEGQKGAIIFPERNVARVRFELDGVLFGSDVTIRDHNVGLLQSAKPKKKSFTVLEEEKTDHVAARQLSWINCSQQ
jgi:hypothetical protein